MIGGQARLIKYRRHVEKRQDPQHPLTDFHTKFSFLKKIFQPSCIKTFALSKNNFLKNFFD
jgi:hypothetical protein